MCYELCDSSFILLYIINYVYHDMEKLGLYYITICVYLKDYLWKGRRNPSLVLLSSILHYQGVNSPGNIEC